MRKFDHIPDVVAELAPQLPLLEERFNKANAAFKQLLAQDHDFIGRVLKCHLIIENYINRHLEGTSPSHYWPEARLSFPQKVALLPRLNPKVMFVVPGIKELHGIRNHFAHWITATVSLNDLTHCIAALAITRRGATYDDPIKIIEDFTTVACTWLIVDPEIEAIFIEAFARARMRRKSC